MHMQMLISISDKNRIAIYPILRTVLYTLSSYHHLVAASVMKHQYGVYVSVLRTADTDLPSFVDVTDTLIKRLRACRLTPIQTEKSGDDRVTEQILPWLGALALGLALR